MHFNAQEVGRFAVCSISMLMRAVMMEMGSFIMAEAKQQSSGDGEVFLPFPCSAGRSDF